MRSCWVPIGILLVSVLLIASPAETLGKKPPEARRYPRHGAVVVRPPAAHTRIVVRDRPYYYHGGVYYVRGRRGYTVVRGPVGARIPRLPAGFITVYVSSVPYYYYYGVYYRYDPVEKVYIVVDPPVEVVSVHSVDLDEVRLIDGTTLQGMYLGGTQSTVQLEVDGEVREIPVAEIVSITFAPPPPVE